MGNYSKVQVLAANPLQAEALSNLALASKGFWGYSDSFLESCREELTYKSDDLSHPQKHFFVAESEGHILGFYALYQLDAEPVELEALFVRPENVGQGIGKILIKHLLALLENLQINKVLIQGDPNAEHFYQSIGAVKVAEKESLSIPGRMLPLFELQVAANRTWERK